MFLNFYTYATRALGFVFDVVLAQRLKKGRVDGARMGEYRGQSARARPEGHLIWLHGASVGEAQSALRLVDDILARYQDAHVLVTTGTLTSAALMARKLPDRAFHQFYPLDRPDWVAGFLDHWRPDAALWMESEIWPNMLRAVKARGISAYLLNGRLSVRSAKRWRMLPRSSFELMSVYDHIFSQTRADADAFERLGARSVSVSGNIKYSALDLPYDAGDYAALKGALDSRPVWLYASTHAGEEALSCDVHKVLKAVFPDLLTLVVPRHPERGAAVLVQCQQLDVAACLRGDEKTLPVRADDVYIANTLGELGLFYRLAPVAVIGRSFSVDGGGGHNPIEAAQLGAGVVSGVNVRYQREIFDEMAAADAALMVERPSDLAGALLGLLQDENRLKDLQDRGLDFVRSRQDILLRVEDVLFEALDERMRG